ncbi:MAG: ACT domain-containing protein [Desulfobacteraceae bacterium]|nr:ACT domain-containing protein [Desulfobacteraceae bacterium]
MLNKYIITVLGKDRPGIIAKVTAELYTLSFNIEDVSQTILQGEFSGFFIVTGPDNITPDTLMEAFQRSTSELDLHFHIKEFAGKTSDWATCECETYVITTRGPDRKGLVAQVTAVLANHNVNVTQLQAVFRGGSEPGKNIMIYEVDVPLDIDQEKLRKAIQTKAAELDLRVSIQHKRIFEAINRI